MQVAYDAHEGHGVTPVEWGERCALTLWFTDVPEHCEDGRLLTQLAGGQGLAPGGRLGARPSIACMHAMEALASSWPAL